MTAVIRPETPDDAPAIAALLVAAFGGEGSTIAALVDDLRRHPSARDRRAWVAEIDGRVVGFVMVTRGWLDAPERLVEVGVLAPLAVAPDHQRAGIGAALVERACEQTQAIGLPALFLEGDPGYYSRVGFEPGASHGFRKPSLRIPDAAFQGRLLGGYASGMSGTLVYPEPFWAHDCVGLRD
jgi:putative acetyltransferase